MAQFIYVNVVTVLAFVAVLTVVTLHSVVTVTAVVTVFTVIIPVTVVTVVTLVSVVTVAAVVSVVAVVTVVSIVTVAQRNQTSHKAYLCPTDTFLPSGHSALSPGVRISRMGKVLLYFQLTDKVNRPS